MFRGAPTAPPRRGSPPAPWWRLSTSRETAAGPAGHHHAGLADPAGPDDRHEAAILHTGHQLRDKVGSAEEVGAVLRPERPQTLVRIAGDHPVLGLDLNTGTRYRRVLAQDLLLEVSQLARGLDAELLVEGPANRPVLPQRVGLPAAPIQRQHQLSTEPLPPWMLVDECLELTDEPGGVARRKIRGDAVLDRHEPALCQALSLGQDGRLVPELPPRHAAPQRQGAPQLPGGGSRIRAE